MALEPQKELTGEAPHDSPEATVPNPRTLEDRRGIAARALEIGARCTALTSKEWRERNWDAELYDELGLPKCEGSDFSATDVESAMP